MHQYRLKKNQPGIKAQQAAVGVAAEQKNVARSYFLPQMEIATRFTQRDQISSVDIPNPLSGPLGDVFADSAAFFGIARQAGSTAALAALNNRTSPPFSTARQAALSSLPATMTVDLLGDRFLTNEVLATQALYTGGKIRYRNRQANLGIEAAVADVSDAKYQTIYLVTRAFYGTLLAEELVRVAEDAEGQFEVFEAIAKGRLEDPKNISVTKADVNRLTALKHLAASQKLEFERATDDAKLGLRTAMGLDSGSPPEVSDGRLVLRAVKLELQPLLEQAMSQRPELLKADLGRRNATLQKKLAAAQFRPDVYSFGRFSTIQDDKNFVNPTHPNDWAVGVEAHLPLVTGGRRLAESHKADLQVAQANEVFRLVQQRVSLEVEQAFLEHQETSRRLELDKKTVTELESAIKVYQDQIAADLVKKDDLPRFFESLQTAQLLLSQAEAGYYQHIFGYNLAIAKINLATGTNEQQILRQLADSHAAGYMSARDTNNPARGRKGFSAPAQGDRLLQSPTRSEPKRDP